MSCWQCFIGDLPSQVQGGGVIGFFLQWRGCTQAGQLQKGRYHFNTVDHSGQTRCHGSGLAITGSKEPRLRIQRVLRSDWALF